MTMEFGNYLTCLFFGLLSVCTVACSAQDSSSIRISHDTSIVSNKYASVKEDLNIADLANRYDDYNRKKEFTDGYRIQIMYTDIRTDAYKNKGQMYKDFPDLKSYVEYEEPYYKLRVGDFKTRLEATYFLQQVTTLYAGAFIVKDKIRIKQ
jgi:hypothetical protein